MPTSCILKIPTSNLLASHLLASHLLASHLLASHLLASHLLASHSTAPPSPLPVFHFLAPYVPATTTQNPTPQPPKPKPLAAQPFTPQLSNFQPPIPQLPLSPKHLTALSSNRGHGHSTATHSTFPLLPSFSTTPFLATAAEGLSPV